MNSSLNGSVSRNPAMQQAIELSQRCAQVSIPVMLVGERGSGKDWLARRIHCGSSRLRGAWTKLQCGAATPESLASHFHRSTTGTLYLEDIDQASSSVQAQLISLIEQLLVCGENFGDSLSAYPRLIASTVCQPVDLLKHRTLHHDLYFLFRPATIRIPPLRDRVEDIPELVDYFLSAANGVLGTRFDCSMADGTLDRIINYDWPGNLEQLKSCLLRSALMATGANLEVDLELELSLFEDSENNAQESTCSSEASSGGPSSNGRAVAGKVTSALSNDWDLLTKHLVSRGIIEADKAREPLHAFVVDQVEKELITLVLSQCDSVHTKTANRLGINRNTLHKKVKDYDLG